MDLLDGYDVVICNRCGAGFADCIPPQPVFDAYYRDLSKYEYEHRGGRESGCDQERFCAIACTLANSIPARGARILELGCATGGLLADLKRAGFENVQGLDPSPGCARTAWGFYKIPVFATSLFEIPAEPGSYDFVILVGVLEHVEDTQLAISKMRDVLSANGRVYAEVPDTSRLGGRPDAPFQEFSTEHINFFSVTSLSNVFELNGFRMIDNGRAVRPQNENTTCPAAYGVFERADGYQGEFTCDQETERGLLRYIEQSAAVDTAVRQAIRVRVKGRKILIWCTGSHTQRRIATGAFDDVEIEAFVDSNPKYQGQKLHGRPVLQPSDLATRKEPILISSRGYQCEIQDQIRSELRLPNDLILLYAAQRSP